MTAILIGALAGVLASIAVYFFIAEQAHKRVRELRQFFFHGWELKEKMVGATIFSTSMSLATVVIALLHLLGQTRSHAPALRRAVAELQKLQAGLRCSDLK